MNENLEILVEEDTPEAWHELFNRMPWNLARTGDRDLYNLGFEDAGVGIGDPDAVMALLGSYPEGKVWMEYYLDPVLEIGNGYSPYIVNCLEITSVTAHNYVSDPVSILISGELKPMSASDYAISYLTVACPRCQLLATQHLDLDDGLEFFAELIDSENSEWILEDCIACGGTGEWVYDPL